MTVPVRLFHVPAPDACRSFVLTETLTVAQIVGRALPGEPESVLARVVVSLSRGGRSWVIPRAHWARMRVPLDTGVVIRVVPGAGAVATWVSSAIGGAFYAATGASLGGAALNAIWIGTAVATTLAIGAALNALIPRPEMTGQGQGENRYSINGWQNRATPDAPVPLPMGRIRVAPVFAAQPYSEIVGGEQYIRAFFLFGYGRLAISDIRIGETSIKEFTGVEMQIREGVAGDDPVTLTPEQVIEETVGVQLRGPQEPKDAYGNGTGEPAVPETHVYETASNCARAGVILHFPQGLMDVEERSADVVLRIRQRAAGTETWSDVLEETIREKTRTPFYRQFAWALPSRGAWEIELTRMTPDRNNGSAESLMLAAVQSIRPEYPINRGAFDVPLALLSMRVKASFQLNGALDRVNALVERQLLAFDGTGWAEGPSRNPADLFRHALQGPHQPFPVADSEIDLEALQDWWQFCEEKGLHFDADLRDSRTLREMLAEIAAAGRASSRHDGERWGVVIDRPQDGVVDHISPRNSWGFEASRSYIDPPQGIRVQFLDETDDYAEAELIVPWPGHTGPIDLVEEWELPGKTHPDEVAREVYRRMLEVIHRRDRFQVMQEGAVRAATRGDTVLLSHDVLSSVQIAGRVLSVTDRLVILDEPVSMVAGQGYGLRWMAYDGENTIGDSVLSPVATLAGETRSLRLTGEKPQLPPAGAIALFGPVEDVAIPCRVIGIEPGEGFSCRLTLTNDAPGIDSLTDAYTPPEWDPVIGAPIPLPLPAAPIFDGIEVRASEEAFGGDDRILRVAATMPETNTVPVSWILLEHRLLGAPDWDSAILWGGSADTDLPYLLADTVELRLTSYTATGAAGGTSAAIVFTVADDGMLAGTPEIASAAITADMGHAALQFANGDPFAQEAVLFRTVAGGAVDTGADRIATIPLRTGSTVSYIDGDASRVNAIQGGSFDDAAPWTAGGGWTISGGAAGHAPGAASTLSQAIAVTEGATCRGAVSISGRTAGSVTVQLTGGAVSASAPLDDNGRALFTLAAGAGTTGIEIVASSDFDGSIEEAWLFEATAACAPQGIWDYRIAATNAAGIASALSEPITATII